MITNKTYCAASFRKGVTTHSTMDNNDSKQETVDGTGTAHDTNITMLHLPVQKSGITDAPTEISNMQEIFGQRY